MRTAIVEVGGLLSALSALGVQKQLARLPGVTQVEVNYVAGSATVTFDENVIDLKAVKAHVHECGYHCAGEVLPKHICTPSDPPASTVAISPVLALAYEHAGHAAEHRRGRAVVHEEHAGQPAMAEMAHEMGHGAGMDVQAMARDMRNRFGVALAFTAPIFIYSPMGGMFTPPAPPFGLGLNLWLFLLASGAVLWPSWPFFAAAWRAVRNGVLNMAVLVVLSVGTGYLFSVGATFLFSGAQFYEAVTVLLVFILLGHWLEMRARAGASEAIKTLLDLAPP